GFVPILSCFYAVFHPTEGPRVEVQVPPGSITESDDPTAFEEPLLDFDSIKNYIIPKEPLCDRMLILKCGAYRIVSHPMHISNPRYPRNFFLFNFCFVFYGDDEPTPYFPIIKELAQMFCTLEEQSQFLTNRKSSLSSAIEQVFEDLNHYYECMIPLDSANKINLKLFPLYAPPEEIKSYHVPITTVQLKRLTDPNWDPTMRRILGLIDGVSSVKRIADLADADYSIVKKCIQHLMYYDCVLIIDIFQFSNRYACTPDIELFATDDAMQAECASYVASPGAPVTSPVSLLWLYRSLHHGISVREWATHQKDKLYGIDIRRFITFGFIKRIIYRVHSHAVLSSVGDVRDEDAEDRLRRMSQKSSTVGAPDENAIFQRLLKGPRSMDWICSELNISQKEAVELLQRHGEWIFVHA
ncbi:hypothetical protein CANCADRAFT_29503, partial [Tortispora caseinolytica NRRL Y-17796]